MVDGSEGGPNLEHVWRYAIIPLLEERFYGAKRPADVEAAFGLAALRKRIEPDARHEAEIELHENE